MTICLSHDSALEYWRALRRAACLATSDAARENVPTPTPTRILSIHPHERDIERARRILHIMQTHEYCEPYADGPSAFGRPIPNQGSFEQHLPKQSSQLHLLVSQQNERPHIKGVSCHMRSKPFPSKSLLKIGDDLLVCSPELCFVQMHASKTALDAILIGYELCGSYVLAPMMTSGFVTSPAITSTNRIARLLGAIDGEQHSKAARSSLKCVFDGSASPMESIVALLLCLPLAMGGYGIEAPAMNARIDIGHRGRRATAASHYVCDLYWPRARLDVEYDSSAFHLDAKQAAHDSKRRAALGYMGIDVITITTQQVANAADFHRVALAIRKRLGKPFRWPRYDFEARRAKLRKQLLGHI